MPSLVLDFMSGTFDPRITFARTNPGWHYNSAGLIVPASANTPRIDYDPVTLACKGLLIEEARTNLLTYSEQFDNAAWTKANATVTANAVTAPDGTLTADKLVENIATDIHVWLQTTIGVASTNYTLSAYFKAAERSFVQIQLDDSGANTLLVSINLSNGTIATAAANSGTATGAVATVTAAGNGWYRVALSGIPFTSGTTIRALFYIKDNGNLASYTGDGTSGVYVWGAQLE